MNPKSYDNQKKIPWNPKLIYKILGMFYLLIFLWSVFIFLSDFIYIKPEQSILWQSTKLMLLWYPIGIFFIGMGEQAKQDLKFYSVNTKLYYIHDYQTRNKGDKEFNKAFYYWWIPVPIFYSLWPIIKFYWSNGFTGYPNLDHLLIVLFIIVFLYFFLITLKRTYNHVIQKRLNAIAIICSLPYGIILLSYLVDWLLKT